MEHLPISKLESAGFYPSEKRPSLGTRSHESAWWSTSQRTESWSPTPIRTEISFILQGIGLRRQRRGADPLSSESTTLGLPSQTSCVLVGGSPMIPPSTKWLPPGASDLVVGPSENAACSNPSRAETERCSRSYKYKYCLDLFGRLAPSSIAPRRVAIH